MGGGTDVIRVEVVYAEPEAQWMIPLELPRGATLRDAVVQSGILDRAPQADVTRAGVFGRRCPPDTVLSEGDRVELYRPLRVDPKTARRLRAERRRKRT